MIACLIKGRDIGVYDDKKIIKRDFILPNNILNLKRGKQCMTMSLTTFANQLLLN